MHSASLLAALGDAARYLTDDRIASIERGLVAGVQAGRAAHPNVSVSDDVFFAHVCARVSQWQDEEPLAKIHMSDLYLACACSSGDKNALAAFERICFEGLERALMRVTRSDSVIDEVKQQLRVKLFVYDEGHAKILDYSGRGALGAWVRVAALRTALNVVQRRDKSVQAHSGHEPLLHASHIETEYVKLRHAREFETAFRAALAELTPKQRTLLRLHYCDDLTLAQIGRIHSVHESTVSRWLLAARDELFARTRKEVCDRLRLSLTEVDSLMAQLLSRADLSLRTLLPEVAS